MSTSTAAELVAQMDLGTADVHQPAPAAPRPKAKKAKQTRGPKRGLRMTIDHPAHGRFEIRHMNDGSVWAQGDGLALDAALLADKADRPVWIQLAKVGAFRGHAAGPFELTPQTFSEIVANFRATQNKRIPIDFEHASEADPTEGNIPVQGAPAQGWITDLDNRGEGGLWGLVEWFPLARDYIKSGQYRYFSPAIRFGAKDRVTGKPIGARMTSGALTNNPFLDGLKPLAAKDAAGAGVAMSSYSTHETMPHIKAALALHPLASPKTTRSALRDLSDMMARCGGAPGMVDGVDLMTHAGPLRALANLPASSTWADVICVIEELIDAAMDQHLEKAHGLDDDEDEAAMAATDAPAAAAASTETTGAALSDGSVSEKETTMAQPNAAPAEEPKASAKPTDNAEVAHLSDRIGELEREKAGEKTKRLAFEAENASLSAKLADAEAKNATLDAENKRLCAEHKKWEGAQIEADVDAAIANATDGFKAVFCSDRREDLIEWRRSAPAAFAKAAPPPVDADKRHLMRDRVLGADKAPTDLGKARENFQASVKRLMSEEKLSYEAAFAKAARARKAG